MSSISFTISRKRVHSPDFRGRSNNNSSDSENEAPPVKIKKKNSAIKFPDAIASRFRNLLIWAADFTFKDYFQMAIKAGATLPEEATVEEEEEEEDDVYVIEDESPDDENPFVQRLQQPRKLTLSDKCFNKQKVNGSCSSRSKIPQNTITFSANRRLDSYLPIDGINCSNSDPRYGNGNYNFRQIRTDSLKRSAVVSNPDTDIEILLETKPKASTPEVDEIEILSESPSIKQKSRSCQRSVRQASKSVVTRNSTSHHNPSRSEMSAVTQSQSAVSKNYTAYEVCRLREKAQYKLLLDTYINENHYTPVAKKSQSNAEVQVDTENLELNGRHFKKEILQQPIAEFIEKYYKPCCLVLPDKVKESSENKNEPAEVILDDDDDDNNDDDEIQIIDVKLPKYKPKYRYAPNFFSADWIAELRSTVNAQAEERLKIVQEYEEHLEQCKKERLLKSLRVDAPVPESTEPEFPELSTEMDEEVNKALYSGAPDDRMCKITSDYLFRKDIETLDGLNWLNDLVINSYFDLIVERSKQEGYPSVYAYNTFFYSTYKLKGYSSVRRWTRKLDIFSYDLLFIPIHLEVHWCLAVIDNRLKKVCYYDSMGSGEEQCLYLLHEYLCLEYKDKKGKVLDPSIYVAEVVKNIPQQMNGSDCGMFTLKYAEYISRDAEITFTQKNMQYFRRRMVYELLHNQLL